MTPEPAQSLSPRSSAQAGGAELVKLGSRPRMLTATILFVDLMGSVNISNHLSLLEYNDLINDYQGMLREVLQRLRDHQPPYPIGEASLAGDQLAIFFYDPADAKREAEVLRLQQVLADPGTGLDPAAYKAVQAEYKELATKLEEAELRQLYAALRCAVDIKNTWIAHWRNIARIRVQQPVLDVGIGINSGQVILEERGDGGVRIEGYAINFAKRVEGYARYGRFCKIMLSKRSYEVFRRAKVHHVMLKQRAAFEAYEPQPGQLKGLAPGTKVYELKFFHRLAGFSIPHGQVDTFEQIFHADPTNLWAYVNLVNYYLHVAEDWVRAKEVASTAMYTNAQNEKIYYDLALASFGRKEYDNASQYGQRCIRVNDEMDMGYDLLADIAVKRGDWEEVLRLRSLALSLAPESAGYALDVAIAQAELGRTEEALRYYGRALTLYCDLPERFPEDVGRIERLIYGPAA
jgi:class 3 adenylate cyclase